MIIERIKKIARPGTKIPKPKSTEEYIIVRWGKSRGEEALVYQLPMKPTSKKPSEKRLTISAFKKGYEVLIHKGEISYSWFKKEFPNLEKDGSCNFTTLGGIFALLGEANYEHSGIYKRKQ